MKSPRLQILIYLLTGLLFTACVEPLSFEVNTDSEFVLVNGVISNSPDERTIQVFRGKGIDKKEFVPINVRGNIYRDGQLWDQLAVQGTGVLYVPFNLKLEENHTYEIEITTPENEVFRSKPQTVQAKVQMDSLSFEVERRFSGTNFSGLPQSDWFVDIFSHISLPNNDKINYYRWQVDGTFSFIEIEQTGNPQDIISTCYISHYVSENPTSVLSSEGLATGPIKRLVNSRIIDESFLFRHILNVYLHAIDRETFEYYDRAIRLTSGSGSLYDEVPAPLQGNVIKTEGAPETVLGYIDFSLADTLRIDLSKGVLEVPIANVCETIRPCPTRAQPGGTPLPPLPCKCWDCNLIFPNSSLFPPFFWDE